MQQYCRQGPKATDVDEMRENNRTKLRPRFSKLNKRLRRDRASVEM